MKGGHTQNMTGTLDVLEELAMIMNMVYGMRAAMYGQVTREEIIIIRQDMSGLSLSSFPSFLESLNDAKEVFPEHL